MVTEKGRGYAPAERDLDELMHATGVMDPRTGFVSVSKPGWTSVFSDELVKLAAQRDDIIAITAAMAGPTGLSKFAANYPDRFFDVGIAEQHAVTSAAGLALGGKHPVVAIYSTFLNRAFDQLLMDVALINLPVTLVLDRSGVTGSDGASHNGVWDMALTSIVPGIRVAAPRDENALRELLGESVEIKDGPTVVRFPKGDLPVPLEAVHTLEDGVDILAYLEAPADAEVSADDIPDVLIVAVGERATMALELAGRMLNSGVNVTVVDPRWVVPIPQSLVALSDDHDLVITIEDGVIHGGVGSLLSDALNAAEVDTPRRQIGVPQKFLDHGSRGEVLAEHGLDVESVKNTVDGWLQRLFGEQN